MLVFATLWATIPAPALGSCRNIFFLVVVVVDHVLVVAVRCLVLIVSLVVVGCWFNLEEAQKSCQTTLKNDVLCITNTSLYLRYS